MGLSSKTPYDILNKIFENTYLTALRAESRIIQKINKRFELELQEPTYFA